MADDAGIRLENFRALCATWSEEFSPKEVARRLWGTPQQWSDLYHGRKSFGEKLARRIEEHLGLPRLALDGVDGGRDGPLSTELLGRLADLAEADRRRAENVLRMHLDMPALPDVRPVASTGAGSALSKRRTRAA